MNEGRGSVVERELVRKVEMKRGRAMSCEVW